MVTQFESVYFLLGLGICVCCAYSAFKISFASSASTCNLSCRTANVSDSGNSTHASEPFRILDDLFAVVLCLSGIRLQNSWKTIRG